MARQKTSPIEDLIELSSKFPWWVSVILGLISYLGLHIYASRPLMLMTKPGEMGAAAVHSLYTTLAMFGQYVLPFAFGMGALVSAIKAAKQRKLYENVIAGPAEVLNGMNWSDFERLIAEFYRRKGFQVTREGGNGPDGGIDLLLRKGGDLYLVQCKHWKAYKVGVQQVREFYGVMASRGAAGGYYISSGEYTTDARRFAEGTNLELVDGGTLQEMIQMAQAELLTKPTAPSKISAVVPKVREHTVATVSASPDCPLCNAPMSKRIARQGNNAGNEFWGCSCFPKCKGTRPIEDSRIITAAPAPASPITQPALEKRNCPVCGTELVIREFKSGPREGQEFMACLPCKKGWPVGTATM